MIIDCFIFYNELDVLKFRLDYLYNTVDYFVLVESTTTFAGNAKPLFFQENKSLFNDYIDNIIHIIHDEELNTCSAWSRESKQRELISKGLEKLSLSNTDIVLISDVDEIPNRNTLLKNIDFISKTSNIFSFEQDLYYYNLTNKLLIKWYLAKCLNFGVYKKYNSSPNNIRGGNGKTILNKEDGTSHILGLLIL